MTDARVSAAQKRAMAAAGRLTAADSRGGSMGGRPSNRLVPQLGLRVLRFSGVGLLIWCDVASGWCSHRRVLRLGAAAVAHRAMALACAEESDVAAEQATRRWIDQVVVGKNLCPFAYRVRGEPSRMVTTVGNMKDVRTHRGSAQWRQPPKA